MIESDWTAVIASKRAPTGFDVGTSAGDGLAVRALLLASRIVAPQLPQGLEVDAVIAYTIRSSVSSPRF